MTSTIFILFLIISAPCHWDCHSRVARSGVVTRELPRLQRCLAAVHEAAAAFHLERDSMPALVAARHGLYVLPYLFTFLIFVAVFVERHHNSLAS